MVRLVGAMAALVLCLILCLMTLSACADEIESWQPPAELGICARTLAVREAIVAQTDRVHSCAFIDAGDLRAIRALDLSDRDITTLQAGDFEGLRRLRELRLNGNALRELPDGMFEGLSQLRQIHLHDNPGAPFPLRVDLRVDQDRDGRWFDLRLRLPLRPPGRVVAQLQSDGLRLTHLVATIDAGSYVGSGVYVEQSNTSAGTAQVLRAAIDREVQDCGPEACWTGIVLIGHRDGVEILSLAGDGEPPQGLPTLVLRVNAQSFVHDAVVERGVLSGLGGTRYYEFVEQVDRDDASIDCTITAYTFAGSGGRGAGSSGRSEGRCPQFSGSGSGTPAYQLPARRIGAGEAIASDLRSGDPCLASNNLRIEADAASLAATERIDAVNVHAESRCYYYISIAQDPNRAAPFRFAEGESCVVEVVDGQISATGCKELVWWGGWGFGGIDSPAEARADAALTRPYVNGEEDLKRLATVAACETLPELSLTLDEHSFRESPFHHRSVSDDQGLCELSMTAIAPMDALGEGERCVISARFGGVASAYGPLPTRQSGDCDQIVHSADWSEPTDRWSEEELQAFTDQYASQLESLSDADWQRLRENQFCIDDICTPVPIEQ